MYIKDYTHTHTLTHREFEKRRKTKLKVKFLFKQHLGLLAMGYGSTMHESAVKHIRHLSRQTGQTDRHCHTKTIDNDALTYRALPPSITNIKLS